MQTSATVSQGSPRPAGMRQTSGANTPDSASRPGSGKPNGRAHKPLKRPYKPLPTTRYLLAGLTAILMSMGLIAGSMSSTEHFDTKPWDPSQELRWDPFERNLIPGFDPGSLSQSGHRTSEAIPKGDTKSPADESKTESETETTPGTETAPPLTPSELAPEQSPAATFEVPGATQTPTGSEVPSNGQPPVALGFYGAVGSAGPKA